MTLPRIIGTQRRIVSLRRAAVASRSIPYIRRTAALVERCQAVLTGLLSRLELETAVERMHTALRRMR